MALSFKDFVAVNYTPGMPDIVSYNSVKRKKELAGSDVAEASDDVDAKKEPVEVPADVQAKTKELDEVDMSTKASQHSQHLWQQRDTMPHADQIRGNEQAISLHNKALMKHYGLARVEIPGSEKHTHHMGKVAFHSAQATSHKSTLDRLNLQAMKHG